MTQKTSVEDFYEAIKHIGAGSLYYIRKREGSDTEFLFEPVIIDTKDKELTLRILKRVTLDPHFIAFPGTAEAYEFLNSDVAG